MTSREQFEARYPIPTGVEWSEEEGRYRPIGGKVTPGFSVARHDTYVAFWIVWKASREDVVVKLPEALSSSQLDEVEVAEALLSGQGLSNLAGSLACAYIVCKEVAEVRAAIESAGLRASP